MDEKDFIQLFRLMRHDLMNDLQIIQGYLSMDKIDKVKTKVTKSIDYYNEERKLMNLKAPRYIMYILQLNHVQENIRLTYQVDGEIGDLLSTDQLLVNQCHHLIQQIIHIGDKRELYEIHLHITEQANSSSIAFTYHIEGKFNYLEQIVQSLESIEINPPKRVEETISGIICEFLYVLD